MDRHPTPTPRILLVDCDAFFVQVARLEDPEGAGREPLLIVGGSSGRGVVTSASYECRAFGVRSAMPTAHALRLCPDATVVSVPRGAVSKWSRKVRGTLEELAPVVQAASVDEFYLDVTGTERLFRGEDLEATARRIRETVLERTGVSVSIGGGTNRLIAKLAAGRAKPAGVRTVAAGEELDFMRELDLSDIPGVGPSLLAVLEKRGLHTVDEALRVEPEWLERWLGENRGRWLRSRLEGRGSSEVSSDDGRKSVSTERTFARDVSDPDRLERELLRIVVSASAALRAKDLRARTITLKLRESDFTTRSRSRTLPEPIEAEAPVFAVARELLHELRARAPEPVRLLGVGFSNLVAPDEPDQLALFEEAGRTETDRDRTVSRTVDRLRRRFGRDALLPGRIADRGTRRPRRPDEDDDGGEGR